ncbi:MAG TPA: alanine--tRNA ligase [Dehalococcoidia bacterium]|nr:alanine--tRNA ligase [Dehalococcoidia bacterium]
MSSSRDIRDLWTSFFEARGHKRIPSSSLIPVGDPTLLFTTAGMVQLKPWFMGLAEPPARRLISIQKVLRTSDIEAVGNERNQTFFEMLGNFSVGDYFKDEVIPWAWELATTPWPNGLGLEPERVWATIYLDDEESFDLWRKVGIPAERIVRFGEKENYWFAGPVGPCGPNTEINYDFGEGFGCRRPDCGPNCENPKPDGSGECDRFLEFWNLVFMTLYQAEDGSRTPLPQRNVDTGAGFERWATLRLWLEGVDWRGKPKDWRALGVRPTNYDTDLFGPLLDTIGGIVGKSYEEASPQEQRAMRIIADHSRAATFLIAEGLTPSNEGRGYVLRRLIRRATTYGQRLKQGEQYLARTAATIVDIMSHAYEQLEQQREFVLKVLRGEEARFFETLGSGRAQIADFLRARPDRKLTGRELFYLWDTHGFPPELTLELLAEEGAGVSDMDEFERELEAQRERSRSASRFEGEAERIQAYATLGLEPTTFLGYDTLTATAAVRGLVTEGRVATALEATETHGARVEVVLDRTPFYAEGGGQVGDKGDLVWDGGRFVVEDTQAVGEGGVIAHVGRLVEGRLAAGMQVEARVDPELRADTMRNHTATHILHAALRQTLGSHVRQAGSYVGPDRLRFDFTHLEALTPEQIAEVEALANRVVRQNIEVHVSMEPYEEAIAGGALAFFGEKYAETVRVVGICEPEADRCFSKELCGGTHCHASGEVGVIIIVHETSIGAGMRRIEAVTGRAAVERIRRNEDALAGVAALLRAQPGEIGARIQALQEEVEALRRKVQALERAAARDEAEELIARARNVDGVSVLAARVTASSTDYLRELGDGLKAKLGSAVILLGADIGGRPAFVAMSTPDVASRVPAGDVVRAASQASGGGGGGRPELAQGGGTDVSKLDEALAAGAKLAEQKLMT